MPKATPSAAAVKRGRSPSASARAAKPAAKRKPAVSPTTAAPKRRVSSAAGAGAGDSAGTRSVRGRIKPVAVNARPKTRTKSPAMAKTKVTQKAKAKTGTAARGARKPNGIKGTTAASRANDALRDQVLASLAAGGVKDAECRIVFGHHAIYACGNLMGYVGKGGLGLRAGKKNKRQQAVLLEVLGAGATVDAKHGYWSVDARHIARPKDMAKLAKGLAAAARK